MLTDQSIVSFYYVSVFAFFIFLLTFILEQSIISNGYNLFPLVTTPFNALELEVAPMRHTTVTAQFPKHLRKLTQLFVMVFAFTVLCSYSAKAKTVFEISDQQSTITVESYASTVDEVLEDAGITLQDTDLVSVDQSSEVVQLNITHPQYASVLCDGAVTTASITDGETVGQLLEQLYISLGENDLLSADLDATLSAGDAIQIQRVDVTYYTEESYTPYDTQVIADPTLARGETSLVQAGVEGKTTYTYQQTSIEGGEPTTELYSTDYEEMQPEITAYGTKVSFRTPTGLSQSKDAITNIDDKAGTLTLASGKTYQLKSTTTVTCTAYTANQGARTASGRVAQVGVVAVDPRVFPMGSKLLIQSEDGSFLYGVAVAGDTGGAIKGHIIDLYFNSNSECINFGRRTCTVYVLE
jgi:3D (Asp-Asp-Asp) domain-containing protein/uncharacterized protein YabE (DUF348 family)